MTVTEAARQLGLKPATLRAQIKNRKLKAHKMGTDWYISPAEVARYAVENRRDHRPTVAP